MMPKRLALTVLLAVTAAAGPAFGQCLSSPVTPWPIGGGGNGHTYQSICAPASTWFDADESAQANAPGCSLATITSAEENAFIDGLSDLTEDAWIGGLQAPGQGDPGDQWGWVTLEAFTFSNWAGGEPNDDDDVENDEEDCLQFYQLADWNDLPCTDELNQFVVECLPVSVVEVPTLSPAGGSLFVASVLLAAVYALRRARSRKHAGPR